MLYGIILINTYFDKNYFNYFRKLTMNKKMIRALNGCLDII